MAKMKKAVGYIRVSTDMQVQEGYSLENQKLLIERECDYRGWELERIFKDEGISGASINERSGIRDLLRFVKVNQIDYVVIFKISRLSRSIADTINIVEQLKLYNCDILAIKDGIDTSTSMGIYFLTLGAIFAEMERENLRIQVKGGMEQKAREGEWNGGKPPLGYDLDMKNLIINKAEAEIVKTIFQSYLNGNGYKTIAENLNKQGYKTKRGNSFSITAVKDILRNPIYCGMIRWGYREDWGKKIGGKRKRKYSENPILQKGKHEAIISEETFHLVQEKIETNPRHHVKRFDGHHLLSGLLKCPHCGEYSMSIHRTTKNGKVYEYYVCNQYQNNKSCSGNGIRKEKIESEFLEVFQNKMNQPEIMNMMLSSLNNSDAQIKSIDKEISHLKKESSELLKKRDNLINLLAKGEVDQETNNLFMEKIGEFIKENASIEKKIRELENKKKKINESQLNIDEIKMLLENVGKVITLLDKPRQQSLIRKVVEKITVKDNHIHEIYFKFSKGLKIAIDENNDKSPSDFRVEEGTANRTINRGKNCCR